MTETMLLDNPNRRALYDAVLARPGDGLVQIATGLRLGRMVAHYHLAVLEDHGLVTSQRVGRRHLYFPGDAVDNPRATERSLLMRHPTRRNIAGLLCERPEGWTQAELVGTLGRYQRLVSYHLQQMCMSGLAEGTAGRPRRFRATPALVEMVNAIPAR